MLLISLCFEEHCQAMAQAKPHPFDLILAGRCVFLLYLSPFAHVGPTRYAVKLISTLLWYSSSVHIAGGLATTIPDVPLSCVLMLFFIAGAVLNVRLFLKWVKHDIPLHATSILGFTARATSYNWYWHGSLHLLCRYGKQLKWVSLRSPWYCISPRKRAQRANQALFNSLI